MGLSLLATLKLALQRLEAVDLQTEPEGDFENARRALRLEINAEFIRCVRDATDRQVPCTTPAHDRPGAAS